MHLLPQWNIPGCYIRLAHKSIPITGSMLVSGVEETLPSFPRPQSSILPFLPCLFSLLSLCVFIEGPILWLDHLSPNASILSSSGKKKKSQYHLFIFYFIFSPSITFFFLSFLWYSSMTLSLLRVLTGSQLELLPHLTEHSARCTCAHKALSTKPGSNLRVGASSQILASSEPSWSRVTQDLSHLPILWVSSLPWSLH